MRINFYMVLRDDSTYIEKRHATLKSAVEEADRLTKKHPDIIFYILECVGAKKVELKATEIEMFKKTVRKTL